MVRHAADDVEDIANHFEIKRFSVVGRSGGAPHALACAAELPGRVICVAALCSLAPYRAPGLDWTYGMAPSNVKAYKEAEADTSALIATISAHREELRASTEGLLQFLGPELESSDRHVIGDVALRRLIAQTHADAVRGGIDGWVDDVLALGNQHGWGFDLADISVPVLLWHGADDKFSPPSHAEWLYGQISTATLDMQPTLAHFDAVKILPSILSWVLREVDEDPDKAASASDDESRLDLVLAGL
jgi:pimeloyl-ACP methyl ester carboxylesterase